MTITRRNALALTAAVVAAGAPTGVARTDEADAALTAAHERWQWLDQQVDALAIAEDEALVPIRKRAGTLFGEPPYGDRLREYMAYLEEHDGAAGIPQIAAQREETEDAANGALDEIIATPANGPRGLLVKAELLKREFEMGVSEFGPALVESLIADLTRIAGGRS